LFWFPVSAISIGLEFLGWTLSRVSPFTLPNNEGDRLFSSLPITELWRHRDQIASVLVAEVFDAEVEIAASASRVRAAGGISRSITKFLSLGGSTVNKCVGRSSAAIRGVIDLPLLSKRIWR
jgi:hypothetical protein